MVPSIIGEDLMITGNVTSKGEIQVDGEIQGDVNCGSLLLGDKSQIIGCVLAEDVVVRGRVLGSIRGLRVTLQAQSHVEGDIFHQSLAIEQGAYFEGKSRRTDDPLADSRTCRQQRARVPSQSRQASLSGRPSTSHQLRQRLKPADDARSGISSKAGWPANGASLYALPALCLRRRGCARQARPR